MAQIYTGRGRSPARYVGGETSRQQFRQWTINKSVPRFGRSASKSQGVTIGPGQNRAWGARKRPAWNDSEGGASPRGADRHVRPMARWRPESPGQFASRRHARGGGPDLCRARRLDRGARGLVLGVWGAWRHRRRRLASRLPVHARDRAEDRTGGHQRAHGHARSKAPSFRGSRTRAALGPVSTSAWVVVADSRTNRRTLSNHARVIRSKLPADGRTIRAWLGQPVGSVNALSFLPSVHDSSTRRGLAPVRRVRPSGAACARA